MSPSPGFGRESRDRRPGIRDLGTPVGVIGALIPNVGISIRRIVWATLRVGFLSEILAQKSWRSGLFGVNLRIVELNPFDTPKCS